MIQKLFERIFLSPVTSLIAIALLIFLTYRYQDLTVETISAILTAITSLVLAKDN